MRRVALILLLMMSAAHADTRSAKCRFLPHSEGCKAPVPAPSPPVQPPVVAPPPVPVVPPPAPQATPVAPPVAAPVVVRPAPPKRVKTKAVKVKPAKKLKPPPKSKPTLQAVAREARRKDNAGPDLPWACWQVRLGVAGKTEAELRAEGRAKGIRLSRKQLRQAKACLANK